MPGAVADLTNTLGRTVRNYYAPNWVRYDSLKFSNPAKIDDFSAGRKKNELAAELLERILRVEGPYFARTFSNLPSFVP